MEKAQYQILTVLLSKKEEGGDSLLFEFGPDADSSVDEVDIFEDL